MATGAKKATERVVFIEYDSDGRPFTILTREGDDRGGNTYDVDWCKRDKQLYYHLSGGGPYDPIEVYPCVEGEAVYWAAKGATVVEKPGGSGRFRRLTRARYRRDFELELRGGWGRHFCEGETVGCDECDDRVPTGDTDSPCEHIWWCDDKGWWSTPGERCDWDCDACREEGRETAPEPPVLNVARGYGMAASPVASVTRRILADRGLTPESLGSLMRWYCDEKVEAVRKALRGEVDPRITADNLLDVAGRLEMERTEAEGLLSAFGLDREPHKRKGRPR